MAATMLAGGLAYVLAFTFALGFGWNGWGLVLPGGASLVFGLLYGLVGYRASASGDIETAEALAWSWPEARKGVLPGLLLGLAVFAGVVLFFGSLTDPALLRFGLVCAVLPAAGVFILFGLRGKRVERKSLPNQGIRLSLRNALLAGATLGVGGGILFGASAGTLPGVSMGLRVGLLAGLGYGAFDVLKHYVLRSMLWLDRRTPRDYVAFLDYACDRGLLQHVGGGYLFVNRPLADYFAAQREAK